MSSLDTIADQDPKVVADKICQGQLEIIKFVEELNPVLTNGNHDIRLEGVETLSKVIISLPNNLLLEKEIEVLCEFLCLRLVDHNSMEQPVLNCLSYFVDCDKKPKRFNKTLLEFLKTKTNIHKMDVKSRKIVYEITRKILVDRHNKVKNMDSDLVYSLIHMIEGESNPQNLLLCFNMVSFVMKNFQDLEPYIDDLFEWLSSYYPIDYTPSEEDTASIIVLRTDLVEALYDCFYANELNAANLQTLLLEKLDSNVISTKLESLNCLTRCYERFSLKSVRDYASSLWTCVRLDCLKKVTLVDPKLLETSYKALSALSKKLAEDDEVYFTFVSDMYEELAIAFRKPEMELFEPAAQLLSNAAQPKIKGFNYILSKIIPVSLAAGNDHKISIIDGLTYIYDQLCEHHKGSKLLDSLKEPQSKLVCHLIDFNEQSDTSTKLLKAMISFRVELTDDTLSKLIDNLKERLKKFESIILEECLAIASLNYKFSSIIADSAEPINFEIGSLIKLVEHYSKNHINQFIIYLRLMILLFDNMTQSELNDIDIDLNKFLLKIREKARLLSFRSSPIETIALLHFIVINKLEQQKVDPILMKLFSSDFCQKLVPVSDSGEEKDLSRKVYLPILKWILKSVALRNHHLTLPLINLLLNYITSSKVDEESAIVGSQVFSFVISKTHDNFSLKRHYQIFALYKQKFYAQTCKEVKIRYEIENDSHRKHLIISTLALQIPHLEASVFKREYDWLLRELIKVLNNLKLSTDSLMKSNEELLGVMYHCLESLIKRDTSGNMLGLLNSLVNLDLFFANQAQKLVTRKLALDNLYCIASSFKDQELLLLRQQVVANLKPCLGDKKRLVRQAAAQARLRWILVGQPIGP